MKKYLFLLSFLVMPFLAVGTTYASDGSFTASNATLVGLELGFDYSNPIPDSLGQYSAIALFTCSDPTNTCTTSADKISAFYGNTAYPDPETFSVTIGGEVNGFTPEDGETYYIGFYDSNLNDWYISQGLVYDESEGTLGVSGGSSTPEGDSAVLGATTDTITGIKNAFITRLGALIPVAAVLLISVAVIFFVIKKFRATVRN